MRKSAAAIWITALNNLNEFQINETHGALLKCGKTYSPFGLLCEMHRRYTSAGQWCGEEDFQMYKESLIALPKIVQEWAGLSDRDVQYLAGKRVSTICAWVEQYRSPTLAKLARCKLFQLELPIMVEIY